MRIRPLRFSTFLVLLVSLFSHLSSAETFKVMLHTGSFPPYFFAENDPRTGTIKDIYSAIAKETGDEFEYVRVPFNRALHLFEKGEIHIEPMTNPAYRGDSSVHGLYSTPFAVAEEIVLFNKKHFIEFNSPEDILGETIGVIKGYYYPDFAPYFEDGRIKTSPVKSENILIKLLAADRYSLALINKDFAQFKIKDEHLSKQLAVGNTYTALDMMLRLHPEMSDAMPRFNKAIEKLKANGTIEAIYDQYR